MKTFLVVAGSIGGTIAVLALINSSTVHKLPGVGTVAVKLQGLIF